VGWAAAWAAPDKGLIRRFFADVQMPHPGGVSKKNDGRPRRLEPLPPSADPSDLSGRSVWPICLANLSGRSVWPA